MTKDDTKASGAPPITVDVAAKLLMIGERRVQQLAQQKWIPKPYTVVGVVQGYLKFLQDEQRRATKQAGNVEIQRERARKLKNFNDEDERQLVRTDDAVATIDAIVAAIKSELSAVAPRITDDVALRRKIEDGIDGALSSLSDRCTKAVSALAAGRDALAADGADDADAVGEAQ